ncbi:MAG: HEPN domain-containing protein [Candidatus Latescibacter sp.]|nr:HEPN domain-containing protein [Candidatus Latescibacter sp.]
MENRNDVRSMLEKARDKLETARILFENRKFDDVVSRSYYAVYHALNAVLISRGLSFSSHAQNIGVFNREFVKTGVFPKEFSEIVQGLF